MKREEILATAERLVNGDRDAEYGTATESFGRIAKLWSEVLGMPVEPYQVAACMVMVKVSRLVNMPAHQDSWVDICGYAGLGGELATGESFDGKKVPVRRKPGRPRKNA